MQTVIVEELAFKISVDGVVMTIGFPHGRSVMGLSDLLFEPIRKYIEDMIKLGVIKE